MADISMETALRKPFNPWPMTIFVILTVLAVLFLTPTIGVLLSSIKTTRAIALGDLWAFPSELYLGNYTEVLTNPSVHQYFINTLIVTIPRHAGVLHPWCAGGVCVRKTAVSGQQFHVSRSDRGHVLSTTGHSDPALSPVQRAWADRHALADISGPHGAWYSDLHVVDAEFLCHCAERSA